MNQPAAMPAGEAFASPVQTSREELPFDFRGSGGEYFRIWIVNLLLSIITVGIYSAWAKVRRMRYFYGNTFLEGHSFEYHGQPLAILKGRIIVFGGYALFVVLTEFYPLAGLAMIPLFIFGVPWIIMRSRLFQMRMTSYRNLRFNFHGTYGGAMGAFVGWPLLVVLTLYTTTPIWLRKRVAYSVGNAAYGRERFRFVTSTGAFYKFWLISIGLGLLAYASLWGMMSLFDFKGAMSALTGDPDAIKAFFTGAGLVVMLIFIMMMLGITGYYEASFNNAAFGGIELGPNFVVSKLQTWPLVWIYLTNFLGIVLTLGLFYPWAKVRQVRYQLENTWLSSTGLDGFTASATQATDAVGEEIGDFFDVDFGL